MKPIKRLVANFLLTIFILMPTMFQGAGSLYFTQLGYNVFAPSAELGNVVLEMQVHSTPSVRHLKAVGVDLDCKVVAVHDRNHDLIIDQKKRFDVTVQDKEPTVRLVVAAALDKETYHVHVRCTDKTNGVENKTNVTVHLYHHDDRRRHHNVTETLCRRPIKFQLAENVDRVYLGTLPCASSAICQHDTAPGCRLIIREDNMDLDFTDYISVEPGTGRLMVNKSFDRELVSQLNMTYVCPSRVNATSGQANYTCSAELTILDVNDNGPWFKRQKTELIKYQETRSHLYELKTGAEVTNNYLIDDKDLLSSNKYDILLDNDYGGLISASVKNYSSRILYSSVSVTRDVNPLTTNISFFNIIARIVDSSFIQSFNRFDNNTAICNITILLPSQWKPDPVHPEFPNVSISPLASIYSQVYVMGYLRSTSEYRIQTQLAYAYTDVTDLFKVTPREGIIYVSNAKLLRHLANQSLVVVVQTCAEMTNCTFVLNINVTVGSSAFLTDSLTEEVSCAYYQSKSSCESATGLGSPEGYCTWRNSSGSFSSIYATCSPSLRTCPDLHCDELELSKDLLCPQDCIISRSVVGDPVDLNHLYRPPRGIARAEGTCHCYGSKEPKCACDKPSSNFTETAVKATKPKGNLSDIEIEELTATVASSGFQRCGSTCRLMLLVGLSSLLVLTLGLVMWKCIYYRRKMQRMRGHGSGIVPSDYVVAPSSVPTDYTDYASTHLLDWHQQNFLDIQVDPKWEFNRGYIKIESVLGEGEFGKVVKAQAWNIQGNPGHTTVAVKMLKECASGVEYRDLLSELNLLKQVNHRNVIKLLGVCTRKGPLYVIVEFCEHGSLRSFLRRARGRKDYLVTRNLPTIVLEIQKESGKPSSKVTKDLAEEGVSVQDLLSFSWQIGKGMEYLSGMKVVHRDLAARNILLATGKVIKISDFGLSRDVYEGDAYLKTSKGPLPVKWMAPESLYDQICTTKSDIWSYGIVLWEIFTLGANPYPGTPAERLYQLLKTGYRMTKPPSCSDELFSVMLKCWQDSPDKRPTFKELADIFEQFLSLDKEYLDLNACEGLLPEESALITPGDDGIVQDTMESDWKEPDPSEVDRYQVPRPTADQTDGRTETYSVPNNISVVLKGVSSLSSPTDHAGSANTSVIPAEGSTKDVCTANGGWEDGVGRAEGGGAGGRGAGDKDEEESNALLLSSQF